jgi:hypothetical protein
LGSCNERDIDRFEEEKVDKLEIIRGKKFKKRSNSVGVLEYEYEKITR